MQPLCTKVPPFSSVRNTSKQSLTKPYKTTIRETLLYNPDLTLSTLTTPAVVFRAASFPVPEWLNFICRCRNSVGHDFDLSNKFATN